MTRTLRLRAFLALGVAVVCLLCVQPTKAPNLDTPEARIKRLIHEFGEQHQRERESPRLMWLQ